MLLSRFLLALSLCFLPAVLWAAPGDLDPSFNGEGKRVMSVTPGEETEEAAGVVIQPGGKIVVLHRVPQLEQSVLIRFLENGQPDPSFGIDGQATLPLSIDYGSRPMSMQPDGKIVVVGFLTVSNRDVARVYRFNEDGSPDATFAYSPVSFGQYWTRGISSMILPDGNILVMARGDTGSRVIRYTASGTLDLSYGTSGMSASLRNFYPHTSLLLPSGRVLAAESSSNAIVISAVSANGASGDLNYGNGYHRINFGGGMCDTYCTGLALLDSEMVMAVGYSNAIRFEEYSPPGAHNNVILAKFSSWGYMDTNFGNGGRLIIPLSELNGGTASAIHAERDGRILLVGQANGKVALWRRLADGSADTSFNGSGMVLTDIGVGTSSAQAMAVAKDGRILIAGESKAGGGAGSDLALARFHSGPAEIRLFKGDEVGWETDVRYMSSPLVLSDTHPHGSTSRFILQNIGSAPLQDITLSMTGLHAGDYTPEALEGVILLPGETQMFNLNLVPSALGARRATLNIASADTLMPPKAFDVVAESISPEIEVKKSDGTLLAQGETLSMGAMYVPASQDIEVVVKNTGSSALKNVSASLSSDHASPLQIIHPPNQTVAAGSQTVVLLRCSMAVPGSFSTHLTIRSNDLDEGAFVVTLAGSGIDPEIHLIRPDGEAFTPSHGISMIAQADVVQNYVLTLRNLGSGSLRNLQATLTDDANGRFSIVQSPAGELLPGESTTVNLRMLGGHADSFFGWLQITSSDRDESLIAIRLFGEIAPAQPVIRTNVESLMIPLGSSGSKIMVAASGEPPLKYVWLKGNKAIAGATSNTLTFNNVKTSDVGAYRVNISNRHGVETSATAYVGVHSMLPASKPVARFGTLHLKVSAVAPPGFELRYRWTHDDSWTFDDENDERFSGAATNSFKFKSIYNWWEAGRYSCQVTFAHPLTEEGATGRCGYCFVPIVDTPYLNSYDHVKAFVGESVSIQVLGGPAIEKFTARGLPPGLTMNPQTGLITGIPTKPKMVSGVVVPYIISCTVVNIAGTATLDVAEITVTPLPDSVSGPFQGLVERHPTLNGGLGGTLSMNLTKTGAYTGKLTLGALSYTFKGLAKMPPTFSSGVVGIPGDIIQIPRKSPLTPLEIEWGILASTGKLTFSIDGGTAGTTEAWALQSPWSKSWSADAYAATYTAVLSPDGQEPELGTDPRPEGYGFATLSVSPTGVARWAGRLADGSTLAGSHMLSWNGEVPFHSLLYSKTGSIQGWSKISTMGAEDSWNSIPHGDDESPYVWNTITDEAQYLDGTLSWWKAEQEQKKTRSYKAGILEHDLALTGGRYRKPLVGEPLLRLGAAVPVYPQATVMEISEGAVMDSGIAVTGTLSEKAVMSVDVNLHTVKVKSLKSATGIFDGSLTCLDDVEGATVPLKRPGTFTGVIVQRLGIGVGHFLLPRLPERTEEKVNETPILSGKVILKVQQDPSPSS